MRVSPNGGPICGGDHCFEKHPNLNRQRNWESYCPTTAAKSARSSDTAGHVRGSLPPRCVNWEIHAKEEIIFMMLMAQFLAGVVGTTAMYGSKKSVGVDALGKTPDGPLRTSPKDKGLNILNATKPKRPTKLRGVFWLVGSLLCHTFGQRVRRVILGSWSWHKVDERATNPKQNSARSMPLISLGS